MSIEQAKLVCVEMLEQRGYTIIDSDQNIIAQKPDGNQVIVFFLENGKFSVENLKSITGIMYESDIFHAIIVYRDSITAVTKNAIESMVDMKIELFPLIDLQYNLTKHYLQPKSFEKLSDKEAKIFKENYGTMIPVLKKSGPLASFFDFQKGDIVRMVKKNGLVIYRIVK